MATLATATLTVFLERLADHVWLSTTANATKGALIVIDAEALEVLGIPVANAAVRVRRGVAGTNAHRHVNGTTVYLGSPDQFRSVDPLGIPSAFGDPNPWINLRTGQYWLAQGDTVGAGITARYWQKVDSVRTIGALGVRTPPVLTSQS
jgi:hypothetical protein